MRKRIQAFLKDNTIRPEEIKSLLSSKADRSDLIELKTNKADRSEVSNNDLKIKVKEKQVEHVIIIMIELIRLKLKSTKNIENPYTAQLKYLLKQALTIFQWVKGEKRRISVSPKSHRSTGEEDGEEGSMMQVRPIYSAIEKQQFSVDLPKQTQAINQNLTTLPEEKLKDKDKEDGKISHMEWLMNTLQLRDRSTQMKTKKDIIFSRRGKSLKPHSRLDSDQRVHTSQGFNSEQKKFNVPHLNFPDPMHPRKRNKI